MHVKFVTLRVISTLGGQIYTVDVISPIEIDWMDLDFGGLDESFIGLGELGHDSLTFFVLSNLVESRRGLNKMDANMDLKKNLMSSRKNSVSQGLNVPTDMKQDSTSSRMNSTSHEQKVPILYEGELDEFKENSTS